MSILEESKPDFPSGIDYIIPYNSKTFLDASINKVIYTLIEAFFGFLGRLFYSARFQVYFNSGNCARSDHRNFFFLQIFGFSINMLTLFAMILAIGIVVDDAIVVVEAVHAKLDEGAKSAKEATLLQ
jgi:HAE1 family hydrophobic/amphiphilic exporter-1